MLGVKLPSTLIQTGDIDIAQFKNISVAVKDNTESVLEVLKQVDKTFRAVPHVTDGRAATSYVAKDHLRVDFLTPNEGRDTDKPQKLPAFGTEAQPLRFLDYLIHEPETAVVLHDDGIYVNVPAPERYAVHKLIISRRRRAGEGKQHKDLQQAAALLKALAQKRPRELQSAWFEAYQRGKVWADLLVTSMSQLESHSRDVTLRAIEKPRAILPGMDLTFNNPPARYDFDRDIVAFVGRALGKEVSCSISREALEYHFGADDLDQEGRIESFQKNRSQIEHMSRTKYLLWPVEEPDKVLIKTEDVDRLLEADSNQRAAIERVASRKRSAKQGT